jgi:3-deoxy-7-phosphoheptulonate synthase
MAHGNPDVILCERGIRTYETSTRFTLDLSAVAVARTMTHLPIIVDPSHAAGRTDILSALCKAAVAIGADGLIVEAHPNPKASICDASQALSLEEFNAIAEELKPVAESIGRRMPCC